MFSSPLDELINLGVSRTIFHVMIVTTNKEGVTRLTFIFLINGLHFGFIKLCINIIFLLFLTLPFIFIFILSGRCELNIIKFDSLTSGRSRRRSILCLRIIRFGIGVTNLHRLVLSVQCANHTINSMRSCWRFWGRVCGRTRSFKDQIVKCSCLRINEIEILTRTNCLIFSDNTTHRDFMSNRSNE
jgi:hypothetical protein